MAMRASGVLSFNSVKDVVSRTMIKILAKWWSFNVLTFYYLALA
jgi:hypothetical protein